MSNSSKLYNFQDLVDLAFNEDSVHLEVLQTILKIVISQLNLDDIKIEFQGSNFEKRHVTDFLEISEIIKDNQKILTVKNSLNEPEKPFKIDPVYKSIPSNDQLMEVMCHEADNPVADMIQLLNVTKRVEALEITAHRLTSMIDALLKLDRGSSSEKKNQSSGTKKCTKNLQTPLGTLGSKKGDKLQEFPCISSFAPCCMEQLLKTESNSVKHSDIHEFECEIKNQIDSVNNVVSENFFFLQHQMCDMQKKFGVVEEEINDLMYACEINDQKLEETMTEIVDFNSNIFCLKSDVKTLLKEQSEMKSEIEIMEHQIVALEISKADKDDMERELNLKATVIELEKMLPRSEFTPLWEDFNNRIEQNRFNQERNQETIKIIFKQFRTELCDKLEKDELEKFKNLVTTLFDTFVSNLRCLLLGMKKDAIGIAGIRSATGPLGCLTCQSEMVMHQTAETIPRLDSVATKFKVDVDKYPVTHARNLRRFCGGKKTVTKPTEKVLIKRNFLTEQESNFLNFPNSQPCFIISTDNLIYKADPIKCLQNLKYRKTET